MGADRYVALLRGINVGRAKRIAMADLRQLIEALGYSEVRTLLNSGNVVFSATSVKPAAVAAAIEEALVLKLGVAATVTVLGSDEVAAIVDDNPLHAVAADPARLYVFVLTDPDDRSRVEGLPAQDWGEETLALGQRAVYVWCPDGILDSRAVAALGKLLGDATTARNWNTMCKLNALCAGQ